MNRILVIEGATAAGATTAAVGGALLWALRSKRKKVLVVSLELKHPVIPSELNNLWNELPNTLRFQHYGPNTISLPDLAVEIRDQGFDLVVVDPVDLLRGWHQVSADMKDLRGPINPRGMALACARTISKEGKCAAWVTMGLSRTEVKG